MPEYHGDLMYQLGNVYTREDDRNYPVAMLLLFFFGFTGLHRFYLNDIAIGSAYMFPFAISIFMGIMTFDFTFFLIYIGVATLALMAEFFYFAYRWATR